MKWITTDPDNNQFRLDEGKDLYKESVHTFKQDDIILTIDLNDYSDEDIINCISSFGYTGEPSLNHYFIDGSDQKIDLSIIAECIFELEIGAS